MNKKHYAQAGIGLYSGVSTALVLALRHHLTPVVALVLCGALGLVHAVLSGYVWELARKSEPARPRLPTPIVGLVGGLMMFACTLFLWLRP